jgi:hypothetical protein
MQLFRISGFGEYFAFQSKSVSFISFQARDKGLSWYTQLHLVQHLTNWMYLDSLCSEFTDGSLFSSSLAICVTRHTRERC